jgi:hypothetical protein
MPQVIIDADEARHFAAFLDRVVEELRGKQSATKAGFTSLKDYWKDERLTQFERVFEAADVNLARFLRNAEEYAAFLRKKAAMADRYHSGSRY